MGAERPECAPYLMRTVWSGADSSRADWEGAERPECAPDRVGRLPDWKRLFVFERKKVMNRLIALMVSAVMTGAAFSGVTTHFALDTRTGVHLVPAGSTLAVDYSPNYSSVQDDATVRVLTNGVVWVESAVGGSKDFTFGDSGLCQFTHQILTNGVVAGEMSAYYAVAEMERIDIPDTWTEIPDGMFKDCTWLTSVAIPSSVTNIATTAFEGCVNITNVVLHGGVSVSRLIAPELVEGTKWTEEAETLEGDKVYRSNPKGCWQLCFLWKVGSEQGYDWLTWYLDGTVQGRISGSQDWGFVSKDLDGEDHVLRFVYSADSMIAVAPDCGWVAVHGSGRLKDLFPDSQLCRVEIGGGGGDYGITTEVL